MRGIAVAALLLSACTQSTTPSLVDGSGVQRSSTPAVELPSPEQRSPSPEASKAERAESPSGLLDCNGPISPMGGRADDFGPEGGGETPEDAFASWIAVNPFGLPQAEYRALGAVGDRWVWVYEVNAAIKVVVVISPRFADLVDQTFTIDELRTCDPSEWGALVDLGPDTRVWAHADTGAILTDIPGSNHCGWESARLLHLTHPDGTLDRQYVRDPMGVLPGERLLDEYAEGVELPADAFDSRYRSASGLEIWFTESDAALYVIGPDVAERWPRAAEPIGCA